MSSFLDLILFSTKFVFYSAIENETFIDVFIFSLEENGGSKMLRDLAMKQHSDIHLLMVEHLVSREERMDNEKMMHQCCYWENGLSVVYYGCWLHGRPYSFFPLYDGIHCRIQIIANAVLSITREQPSVDLVNISNR